MPGSSHILLADDQPTALRGLQETLTDLDHPVVLAHSVEEALRAATTLPPWLLITGFFTGNDGRVGMELLTKLTTLPAPRPTLVRAPGNDPHLRVGLPRLGVSGLVDTSAPEPVLCAAVETVLNGGTHFDPILPGTPLLTERQLAVLQLLARGLPQKQAAAALGIGEVTLHHHLSKVRGRFGVPNTPALVAMLAARRILHLPAWTLSEANGGNGGRTGGRADRGMDDDAF
ncbi:MAG: response regulator transcription factor [Gemmatimonadales bacterium]